ncbi:hypothetical protein MKW94_014450 [Papaver nudicaule]|uniref:Uncharacterized protein n=1 Tax=Papaver nudicaule TaxID=74823 RepID=A0AA41SA65_PAPNU|nr:hypothetical protein [Papaver nudicaule]
MEPSKEIIKTELYTHQKQGLEEEYDDAQGVKLYRNLLDNTKTQTRLTLRGGIFADDMGFANTSRVVNSENDELRSCVSVGAHKKPRIAESSNNVGEDCLSNLGTFKRTTLVVCPPAVLSTWTRQLDEHTKPGALKLFMYNRSPYGNNISVEELCKVILDDAHVLGRWNFKDQKLLNLRAQCRWVVTGMPIDLVTTISLRRLKSDCLVKLPPKAVETFFLELSDEERVRYDQKELDSKEVVQTYIRHGRAVAQYTSVLATVQRLRELCNDAASCTSELLTSVNVEDVSKNPELLQKLFSTLREDYLDCPICISPLSDIVITSCGHIFCKKCILKALMHKNKCCPMCRHHLSKSDLFSSPSEESCSNEDENSNVDVSYPGRSGSSTYSSKVCALLKLLAASRNENPSAKSVVFSQFRKMLALLVEPLKSAGFGVLRLDGTTTAKRRDEVIEKFKNQDANSPTVLLVEFKVSESGIDLTAASRAYLLEPWLNPVVEEQAMDRLHRIGQENMKIVRLVTRNTIEESILQQLHEWKKDFEKDGSTLNQKQLHIEEFRIIMGL